MTRCCHTASAPETEGTKKQIHIVWTVPNTLDKNISKKDKEVRDKAEKWQEGLSKGTGSRLAKEGRDERVQEKMMQHLQ